MNLLGIVRSLLHLLPLSSRKEWGKTRDLSPLRPTIILIAGFGATVRNLSIIRKRLIQDGFNVVVLALDRTSLSDSVGGFYRMAERLSSIVIELRKKRSTRKAPIYLIAHSAGGLVARYYIQRLGGSHYCEGLITLATPHNGSWLGILGLFSHLILKARILFQMLPISPFMRSLNRTPFPEGCPMISIYSSSDPVCRKKDTELPQHLNDHTDITRIEMQGISHSGFLMSKKAYNLVRKYLVTGAKPAFGEKNGSFERDKEDEQKARRRGP